MSTEHGVRLRQAVLVAEELDPVAARLREELGLLEPFVDPNVAAFGLQNAVFAIGDAFLEVVSPVQDGTTAGRYLDRHGDGGYMLIFQFADLAAARQRAAAMDMRTVWQLDLPDISGTHLHPADTGGAIVSLDRADPPESWRWGGPDWTEKAGTGAPGRLLGVTLQSPYPAALATRWQQLLTEGSDPFNNGLSHSRLELDGGYVAVREGEPERLVEIELELAGRTGEVEIGGVRFVLARG
jgi:hypothetical protein